MELQVFSFRQWFSVPYNVDCTNLLLALSPLCNFYRLVSFNPAEGQFLSSHFAVCLLEELKDPLVQSVLKKSIDRSKSVITYLSNLQSTLNSSKNNLKKAEIGDSDLEAKNSEIKIAPLTWNTTLCVLNTLMIEGIENPINKNTFDTVFNICEKLKVIIIVGKTCKYHTYSWRFRLLDKYPIDDGRNDLCNELLFENCINRFWPHSLNT